MQPASNSDWVILGVTIALLLVIDLIGHRARHSASRGAAAAWSVFWVGSGLAFCGYVFATIGHRAASEYLAAYLIEKSLSLDNLFVFLVIFRELRIPPSQQHNVLLWGIGGALAFRAIFIFAGIAAIQKWRWLSYVFGAMLMWMAWRVMRKPGDEAGESKLIGWFSRHLPVSSRIHGSHLTVREGGRLLATPMLIAVLTVELTDILFAIDSIPAALSITEDAFIVYSSNAFAILGLRALYNLLATTLERLRYLHYGLAAILAFAGFKIAAAQWVHIPATISVGLTIACLVAAVAASRRADRREARERASRAA